MTIRYAKRGTLTILAVSAALLGSGCELLPGLFSTPSTPDPSSTSAALTVSVDRADGTLEGVPLQADIVEATGFRSGLSLQFDVVVPSEDITISVFTQSTESSSENPYVGGRGDFGDSFPVDAGPPPPGEDGLRDDFGFDPSQAQIMACGPTMGCVQAEDFGLEIAQLADGRTLVLDGTWSGSDQVHLELTYHEQL